MTPQLCDRYLRLLAYVSDAAESPDIPEEWRERAARILKLAPAEVTSIEHSPEPTP